MELLHLNSVRLSLSALSLAALFATSSPAQHYTRTNLVSNVSGAASATDANLVNAWGLARSSTGPWWVANNGSGTSTLYNGTGGKIPLTVAIPGSPTGTVYNGTADFKLPNGKSSVFLFAAEDGTISAWTPGAASAQVVVSRAPAVYKGLAIASIDGKNYLFATDFHAGLIDVFDSSFQFVKAYQEEFRVGMEMARNHQDEERGEEDERRPRGTEVIPFNVQNIGNTLYVTFAKQGPSKHDEVDGAGLGLVAAFTPKGKLLKVFQHGSWLDSPWGLALAPGDFGYFSHSLLVGQFGSGQIAAYNVASGKFLGMVEDASGNAISVDGLWAISFGNGQSAGAANALYFAAGPNGESGGLFGMLAPAATDQVLGNGN